MTRRGASILLDSAMLVIFLALMSWRITGVPAHEWAALGLIGLLLLHLLIHWHWIETRIERVVRGTTWRTRVNVLLNTALFVMMGSAMVSGVLISKVVVPNRLSAPRYLAWHSLHDVTSTLALVILGLHLALNWELIENGARKLLRREQRERAGVAKPATAGLVLRRLALIAGAAIVVTGATRAAGSLLPAEHRVMIVRPNGHIEASEPPPEITTLLPGSTRPSLSHVGVPFIMRVGMLIAVAMLGRKLLRLRLS